MVDVERTIGERQGLRGRLEDAREQARATSPFAPSSAGPGSTTPSAATPIGGQGQIRLIEGLDGILRTSQAAAHELSSAAKELRILNERQAQMYGTTLNNHAEQFVRSEGAHLSQSDQRALVDAFKAAATEQANAMIRALPPSALSPAAAPTAPTQGGGGLPPEDRGGRTQIGSDWTPESPSGGRPGLPGISPRTISPASTGDTSSIEDLNGAASEPNPGQADTRTPQEIFEQRRDYFGSGGKLSISNLRRDFGRKMTERLSDWHMGDVLTESPLGTMHMPAEDGEDFGRVATQAEIAAFRNREAITGAVRGAANALGEGATMREAGLGMLGGGAAKAAGGIGAAVAVYQGADRFLTDQRAANNQWISQMGGGQTDALRERFGGQIFRLNQFGTLNDQDADALYRGVAFTGMDQSGRQAAMDFAVENFKDMGMSVQQSLEIITVAARTGQEDLTGVAASLRGVSDAAREAGVNTETARTAFVNAWKEMTPVLGGAAATATAGAITEATMGLGRGYEGMTANITNPMIMRMVGMRSGGATYNDLLAESMSDPTAYLNRWQGVATDVVGQQLTNAGGTLIAEAYANRRNAAEGGAFTQGELNRLSGQLLRSNAFDVPTMTSVIEQFTGISGLSPQRATEFAIMLQSGQYDPAREARQAQKERRQKGKTTTVAGYDEGWNDSGEYNALEWDPSERAWTAYGENVSSTKVEMSDDFRALDEEIADDEVGTAFMENVSYTHRAGGVSQAIVQADNNAGVENVRVQTSEGERIVSLAEAMTYFRDQIDAGTAKVVGGTNAGRTLAKVIGAKKDRSVEVFSDKEGYETMTGESVTDIGKTVDEFMEDAGDGEGGTGGGSVVIKPTPWLRQFLEFTTEGNVIDPDSVLGPPQTHILPNGRPTGGRWR